MQKIKDYFSNPATRISLFVFAFGLGGAYATLNNRLSAVEQKQEEFNVVQIQAQLAEISKNIAAIQVDVEWLKKNK